jgi:hypothetical protein
VVRTLEHEDQKNKYFGHELLGEKRGMNVLAKASSNLIDRPTRTKYHKNLGHGSQGE